MGEHGKSEPVWRTRLVGAVRWVVENRRKIYAAAVVAIPLVSRYVPGFPSDEILGVLRAFLGA